MPSPDGPKEQAGEYQAHTVEAVHGQFENIDVQSSDSGGGSNTVSSTAVKGPVLAQHTDGEGNIMWEGYDSIQNAVDAVADTSDGTGGGGEVYVGPDYDESADSFPITWGSGYVGVDLIGYAGPQTNPTISNGSTNNTIVLNTDRDYPPGVKIANIEIECINSSGSPHGIKVNGGAKHNRFVNVTVDDGGNNNNGDGVNCTHASGESNSVQLFDGCGFGAGRDGVRIGDSTHFVAFNRCTFKSNGRCGVLAGGSVCISVHQCQMESNGGPGFQSDPSLGNQTGGVESVHIGGASYFEDNADNSSNNGYEDADLAFYNTGGVTVSNSRLFANSASTQHAIFADSDCSNFYLENLTFIGHTYLLHANMYDCELNMASHYSGSGVDQSRIDVKGFAQYIRDNGYIIDAGANNGGNGDMRGVDLSSSDVTGNYSGDKAISDGSSGVSGDQRGLTATWVSSSSPYWLLSNGTQV